MPTRLMADEDEDAVLQASLAELDIAGGQQRDLLDWSTGRRPKRGSRAAGVLGVKARDITTEFVSATSKLKAGELVKDESFSLFDAVGALEVSLSGIALRMEYMSAGAERSQIMDPKMDNGFLAPGETLEHDYDVNQSLSPEQVLGIMDALSAAEVAWQMGHSFNVTLFTSVYVDQLLWPGPIRLEDAKFTGNETTGGEMVHVILRSYCLAMIKACDIVHRMICAETYYEEEDFVSNTFNRSLLTNFEGDEICVLVENAIATVNAMDNEISDAMQVALISRLKYRMAFLRAVMAEPRKNSASTNDYWKTCMDCLEEVEKTHQQAIPVEGSFSIKLQRKLDSTIPPRPIIRLDFDVTTNFLRQLCTNAIEAVEILNCPRVSSIIVFFSQKPQPAIYVRCVVQAMIFDGVRGPQVEGRRAFFFEELEELVLPAHPLTRRSNAEVEYPEDDRFKMLSKMSRFVEQVCEPFFDILRALCMNRSRARRMMCNLLNEWDGLQLDLEDLDNELRPFTGEIPVYAEVWELPLSSWGYYYKLRQMQWIIQLGFELQMYHSDEWPGLYRYLQEVAEHRHIHIKRIYGFVHHHAGSRPISEQESSAFDHCLAFLVAASEEAIATAALAESFSHLYQALALLRLLPTPPPRPYGSASLRHALRLRPFLPLCLPTISSPSEPFSKVDEISASLTLPANKSNLSKTHRRALALLDAADVSSRRARKAWDWLSKADASAVGCVGYEDRWRQSIKSILRAAITSGVAGARIRKWVVAGGIKGDLKVKIHLGTKDDEMLGGIAAPWVVPEIS